MSYLAQPSDAEKNRRDFDVLRRTWAEQTAMHRLADSRQMIPSTAISCLDVSEKSLHGSHLLVAFQGMPNTHIPARAKQPQAPLVWVQVEYMLFYKAATEHRAVGDPWAVHIRFNPTDAPPINAQLLDFKEHVVQTWPFGHSSWVTEYRVYHTVTMLVWLPTDRSVVEKDYWLPEEQDEFVSHVQTLVTPRFYLTYASNDVYSTPSIHPNVVRHRIVSAAPYAQWTTRKK